MASSSGGALHVRNLDGATRLCVPRTEADDLLVSDLKSLLVVALKGEVAGNITGGHLWLTIGSRILHEDDEVRALWPSHGGDLEVQLAVRWTREDQVELEVMTCLDHFPASGAPQVLERIASIDLRSQSELVAAARAICAKAFAEPCHSVSCAEVSRALHGRYPSLLPVMDGEKPANFRHILLNLVQGAYESVPPLESTDEDRAVLPEDEVAQKLRKEKLHVLAVVRLTCHLFLVGMVAQKVIGQVVHDLIVPAEGLPRERSVECVCEMLRITGPALDSHQNGRMLVTRVLARLGVLQRIELADGRGPAYSEGLQVLIQDLLEMERRNWDRP